MNRSFFCTAFATEACNLSCDYCFVYKWRSRGLKMRSMDVDIAERMVDFMAGEGDALGVGWFGGEPTLNVEVIRHTYSYATKKYPSKAWEFSMTTNGVLLSSKEVIRRLDGIISSIIVSIDGVEEAHDMHRRFRNGAGSWKFVEKGLVNTLNWLSPSKVTARLTLAPDTITFMSESVKHLLKLGAKTIFVGIVPELDWDDETLKAMYDQYLACGDLILRLILEGEEIFFGQAYQGFEHLIRVTPYGRHEHCGTARNSVCIDVDGSMWACHRFKGYDEFKVGDVRVGWDSNARNRVMTWFDREKAVRVNECPQDCPFLATCSFGCLACNYESFKDVNRVHKPITCLYNKACLDIAVKWFLVGRYYQNNYIDKKYIEPLQQTKT